MTAKRFELVEYADKGLFIQDNANGNVQYYQESRASLEKVVDLLNEQHEENQDLHKKEVELGQNYLKLLEENERLKQNIDELLSLNVEEELLKENEQLKSFIDDLTTKGTGRIDLANGYSYRVSAVLTNWKGDVE